MNEENQVIADKASVDVETLVMPLKWQLVSEGLPPERTRCLVYGRWQIYTKAGKLKQDNTILSLAVYAGSVWNRLDWWREWHSGDSDKITHYIIIPELPL
ncbi:MAG: hypothetical protein ABIG69_11500 [Bacteroidota bacterium]